MEYLLLGIGGALGSITRYKLGKIITEKSNTSYPIGTFIINITGAVLLGILSSINANKNVYILLGDGFLGAYTTFSTFMYEGFNLFQENEKMNAFVYILSTLILGIIGYTIGLRIGILFI
ncbi:MAG: fluoride efflux transporter CrcB [Caloramator sp.]|nr:fluoride efflux transporter CrcB [Caloramator sp.]